MAKHSIQICMGSSCFTRGNNANVEAVKKYLAEKHLEAEISFSGQLCIELCSRGPVIRIDGNVYEEVNLSRLHRILEEEFRC